MILPGNLPEDDYDDLSEPPSGGKLVMILFGIILPTVIGLFALKIWMDQEVITWERTGSRFLGYGFRFEQTTLRYEAAQWAAVGAFSVALFAHSRWFWGMLKPPVISQTGMAISLMGLLLSMLMTFVYRMG